MSRIPSFLLALSLVLAVPALASAQDKAAVNPPPQAPESAQSNPEASSATGRYLLEFGLGAVGGVVPAGGAALYLETSSGDEYSSGGDSSLLVAGGAASILLGVPAGVYWGGEWMGADGSFMYSMLGSLGGTLVGVGTGALLTSLTDNPIPLVVLGTAGPIAGSMLGYEWSLDDAESTPESSVETAAFAPWVSVTPSGDGGLVGLGGVF